MGMGRAMSGQLDAYEVDPVFRCHIWTGKFGSNGRPVIWRGNRPSSAYKVAYELEHGPVEDGLVVDHLCRRSVAPKACVNPLHLEAVTKSENEMRTGWRYRAKRTRCPNGHELALNRIVTPEGGWVCRQCMKEST